MPAVYRLWKNKEVMCYHEGLDGHAPSPCASLKVKKRGQDLAKQESHLQSER